MYDTVAFAPSAHSMGPTFGHQPEMKETNMRPLHCNPYLMDPRGKRRLHDSKTLSLMRVG